MLIGAPQILHCNTSEEEVQRNAAVNVTRTVERFKPGDGVLEGTVVIVGGGPSLADLVEEVRARKNSGQSIWSTNNSYSFLVAHGIQPDAQVILDSRPENADFLHPHPGVTYYLSQFCHPSLFDKLEGCKVVMYHGRQDGTGYSVGIKAMYLAGATGFRNFVLYGFDSSYREDKHHAYAQKLNDGENIVDVKVDDRTFKCAPWMAIQAEEFQQVAQSFADQGCVISVAGDGLLPYIARKMAHVPKVLTAVWDLQICPPTYDFGCFLSEAERARIALDAEAIDLVIQPGPLKGFRNDDLPPNIGAREGMLYRVIVGMARLLPSVRNIEVLKVRKHMTAEHLFPEGYTVNEPKTQYGHHYLQFASPILRSTEAARTFVGKFCTTPYVTITLREATHWPARNSNKAAWIELAGWLESEGYRVVWIPDAESPAANLFSFDLDMRVALSEGAAVNLGINNGPMMILPYTQAKYIVFKMVTDGIPWTSRAFHEKWGTREGMQPGGLGKFVFEADDVDVIVPHVASMLGIPEMKVQKSA